MNESSRIIIPAQPNTVLYHTQTVDGTTYNLQFPVQAWSVDPTTGLGEPLIVDGAHLTTMADHIAETDDLAASPYYKKPASMSSAASSRGSIRPRRAR